MSVPNPSSIVSCPLCSTANPADRRFCVGCGGELKDECPKCRSEISSSDSFCSGCGYNVKDHYEKQIVEIEDRLKHVEELVVESKFDDAISVLSLLSRYSHQRVRSKSQQVEKLYSIVREKRDQKVKEVLALCDSAKLYATTGLISSAIVEFERVPRNMLPPKAKVMLDELRFKQSKIDALKQSIKRMVAEKKVVGLLPRVASLLSLSSNEEEYEELGQKLATRLISEVKKLVVGSKYQNAFEVSRDLVPPYDNAEVKRLKQLVRDRLSLEFRIKRHYLADRNLLEMLQKLKKVDPKHPDTGLIDAEAKKLMAAKAAERRVNIRVRTKTADSAIAGVQPWNLLATTSIKFTKTEFEEHSIRYIDCLGLGLQAIGEVLLRQSFSESKSSLLSIFGAKKPKEAWGVVIEGTTLRAIRISASKDATDLRPVVDQMLTIPYTDPEPVEGRLRLCQQSVMSKLLQRVKGLPGEIALGLSPRKVLPRFFTIPSFEQKKLIAAIELELQHQSPFGKEQVIKRYEMFDDTNMQGARPIMGTIVRKNDLEETEAICSALSVKPFLIQSTPQAVVNFLNREWFENEHKFTQNDQGICYVDVGDELTLFTTVWKRRFWWRYIPLGKRDLVSATVRHLKLTGEQATKFVEHPALTPRFDLFMQACIEFYDKLLSEFLRSHNQAEQFMNGIKIPNLIVGGTPLPFLIDSLKFGTDSLLPWSDEEASEVRATEFAAEQVG